MSGLASAGSFLVVIATAVALHRYAGLDPIGFVACSALWWAVRAYYREPDVNTAHQTKNQED